MMGVLTWLKKVGDECMVDENHGRGVAVCAAVPAAFTLRHCRFFWKVLPAKKLITLATAF